MGSHQEFYLPEVDAQPAKAESTIRRFRGRNTRTLSSLDKDALIASMSLIIFASARGIRSSSPVIAMLIEFARDLDGNSA